ncbi:MAG: hypothetical protein D6781_12350 [Verrucomicrobia bacterium]|nr:MAG: hypothetical protein D6781_12350 [Verrucomicrobiota bacterium]
MTLAEFNESVQTRDEPPPELSTTLQALWWDAKGDWGRAHRLAQSDTSVNASWVHAYLHRKEGDETNAAYWYAKAVKPMGSGPFAAERDRIVAALLEE